MDKMNTQELISALADGQLQGEDLARALAAASAQPQDWHAYHLIGDVLRSAELAQATPRDKFLSRLNDSLKLESPPAGAIRPIRTLPAAQSVKTSAPAANDARRWKLVAGFASLAAVGAIGWSVTGSSGSGDGAQLASVPAAPAGAVAAASASPAVVEASLAASPGGMMIRDERLDRLLAAHRQFAGSTALQAPAGFMRNATFEGPAR